MTRKYEVGRVSPFRFEPYEEFDTLELAVQAWRKTIAVVSSPEKIYIYHGTDNVTPREDAAEDA